MRISVNRPRRVFGLACVAALAMTASACGGGSSESGGTSEGTLVLGLIQAEASPEGEAAKFFGEQLEEQTDGRFTVDVVPAAQLGAALDQYQATASGAQHLFLDALEFNGQFVTDYGVLGVPLAIKSNEHLLEVLRSDLGEGWRSEMQEEHGLRTLSDELLRSPRVVFSTEPVESPEDLEGMAFRVPEIDVYFESWKAIGVSPTPVAWGELYLGLQQGVVKGGEGPFTTLYPMNFTEVADHVLLTDHLYSADTIIMNNDMFSDLSEEDQEIFMDVAAQTAEFYTDGVDEETTEYRQAMQEEHNVTFHEPSDAALDEFRKRIESVVPTLEDKGVFSDGIYEQVVGMDPDS